MAVSAPLRVSTAVLGIELGGHRTSTQRIHTHIGDTTSLQSVCTRFPLAICC